MIQPRTWANLLGIEHENMRRNPQRENGEPCGRLSTISRVWEFWLQFWCCDQVIPPTKRPVALPSLKRAWTMKFAEALRCIVPCCVEFQRTLADGRFQNDRILCLTSDSRQLVSQENDWNGNRFHREG